MLVNTTLPVFRHCWPESAKKPVDSPRSVSHHVLQLKWDFISFSKTIKKYFFLNQNKCHMLLRYNLDFLQVGRKPKNLEENTLKTW